MSKQEPFSDEKNQAKNTDKELWRRKPNDFYSPSIHVTIKGKIGINVGGLVYVQSVEGWHNSIATIDARDERNVGLQRKIIALQKECIQFKKDGIEVFPEAEKTITTLQSRLERMEGALRKIDRDHCGCLGKGQILPILEKEKPKGEE